MRALAAIGAALSGMECASLEAAAELAENRKLVGPLSMLNEDRLRVVVFEDAMGGIYATRRAAKLLREAGLDVTDEAVGVSPHPAKQEALRAVADRVVTDINEGLAPFINT